MKKKFFLTAMVVLYAAIAFLISYVVYIGGRYPVGGSTFEYLYHGRLLLDEITNGNFFPIYDKNWYNGSLFLRVYEPIPEYLMAFLIYIVDCDASKAFLLYLAIIFFFGAIAWLYIGSKRGHLILGSVLGVLWFFMPNNLHTIFLEGNLQRGLALSILPLLFYFTYECLQDTKKVLNFVRLSFCACLMILCDHLFFFMCAIVILLFCLGYLFHFEHKKRIFSVIGAIAIGIGMSGIWLYPYISTHIRDISSVESMMRYFQDFWVSINPVYRMEGNDQRYYYGLSALTVAILGMIASNKKGRLGYRIAFLIYLATTSSVYIIISTVTDASLFYMIQFISIALCLILLELLYWDTLKKIFLLACIFLLALDCIPSVLVNKGNGIYTAYDQLEIFEKTSLLDEAKNVSKQRMAFVDASQYETVGQYCAVNIKDSVGFVPQVLGYNWQYAATSDYVVAINEAIERRTYMAFFDNLLQMGCDTIVLYTDISPYLSKDIKGVIEAGECVGYSLLNQKGKFYLFHMDTPECFGTIDSYYAIGIGSSSKLMNYPYIDMRIGESENLLDYSFEELVKYKVVYLSGFTYSSKKAAEDLVLSLAKAGVHILIDASNLMEEEHTGQREFLGVWCQNISFSNGFPILYYENEEVVCGLLPKDHTNWNSVYLNGLDQVTGYFYDNNMEAAFAGKAQHENITFIGINLPYHYFLTTDAGSKKIMDTLLGQYLRKVPKRKIVPLEIAMEGNQIRISSPEDEVNTSLAFLDIFSSEQSLTQQNGLLYVNQGVTEIVLIYRYYLLGAVISAFSVVLCVVCACFINRKVKKEV